MFKVLDTIIRFFGISFPQNQVVLGFSDPTWSLRVLRAVDWTSKRHSKECYNNRRTTIQHSYVLPSSCFANGRCRCPWLKIDDGCDTKMHLGWIRCHGVSLATASIYCSHCRPRSRCRLQKHILMAWSGGFPSSACWWEVQTFWVQL